MTRLDELNGADHAQATAILSPLIERAPHIAERVARHRPFATTVELMDAIRRELNALDEAQKIALCNAHPELAPERPLSMTASSQQEQARLNLTTDTNEFRARLDDLNRRYREKFGFPFITALVRHPDMDSVLVEFETRLASDRAVEIEEATAQIAQVSESRVQAAFGRDTAAAFQDAGASR